MHAPIKYFEKGLSVAANGAWVVFNGLNKINQRPSFTPKWSDKPLLKSYEKTKPPLGWPRETDSLCPTCTREARQAILDGKKDVSVLLNEKVGEIKATILERDGKILMVKDCPHPRPFRGRDGDGHRLLQAPRRGVPRPRHPRAQRREAPQPRQQHDQARPRLGADGRPDQPLQHDVRPLLHGREPGRVRPRAVVGRHQDGARQRDQHQAAAADVGAVLGRRADDFAVLPRRGPLRAQGRLQQRAGGDQRHRVRQETRSSPRQAAEAGLRYAYLQFDGIGNAANAHRRVGNLFDVKLRAIENLLQRRRRHRAGRDDRQRRQQRAGRPHHRVRARQPEEDQLPLVPAGVVHRPRRGSDAGAPGRAALHAVAPRARREEPDRHRRADPRLVPDFVHGQLHRLGRRHARRREGIRPADLRLPPELRRRHGDHDRQGNQGSGAGDGVPQGRAARQGRRGGQRRRPRPLPRRSSAWRSPWSATTTRSSRRRTSS